MSIHLGGSGPGHLARVQGGFLYLDFTTGALPAGATLTRASIGQYADASGVLSTAAIDTARFHHVYNGAAWVPAGLLVEPERTNLWLQSTVLGNASWTKTRSTVTSNAVAGPTGATVADKLVEDATASNTHLLQQNFNCTNGQSSLMSVFAKAGERSQFMLSFPSTFAGTTKNTTFNLATGAVALSGADASGIENWGNGWFRCWHRLAATATASVAGVIYLHNGTSNSYTGDGASGLYLAHASVTTANRLTSPIETTTGAVTRSADVCSFTVPTGISTLRYTFDDDTTQDVAATPGAYTVPTTLNRVCIKNVRGLA